MQPSNWACPFCYHVHGPAVDTCWQCGARVSWLFPVAATCGDELRFVDLIGLTIGKRVQSACVD